MRNLKLRREVGGARTDHRSSWAHGCPRERPRGLSPTYDKKSLYCGTTCRARIGRPIQCGSAKHAQPASPSIGTVLVVHNGSCSREYRTTMSHSVRHSRALNNAIRQNVIARHLTGSDKHNILAGAMWESLDA
jgi:hypothetical protein